VTDAPRRPDDEHLVAGPQPVLLEALHRRQARYRQRRGLGERQARGLGAELKEGRGAGGVTARRAREWWGWGRCCGWAADQVVSGESRGSSHARLVFPERAGGFIPSMLAPCVDTVSDTWSAGHTTTSAKLPVSGGRIPNTASPGANASHPRPRPHRSTTPEKSNPGTLPASKSKRTGRVREALRGGDMWEAQLRGRVCVRESGVEKLGVACRELCAREGGYKRGHTFLFLCTTPTRAFYFIFTLTVGLGAARAPARQLVSEHVLRVDGVAPRGGHAHHHVTPRHVGERPSVGHVRARARGVEANALGRGPVVHGGPHRRAGRRLARCEGGGGEVQECWGKGQIDEAKRP